MKKSSKRTEQGMSLIEVLVAVFILTVGILGALLFFTQAMTSTETAKNLTIATTHAESILEEMRIRTTLAGIQQTDWPRWAESQGFNTLPREKIEVHYDNPGGNPLKARVEVSWGQGSRQGKMELYTEFSK